jgi:DNA-binding NarL/FixJ family response regulator
MKQKEPNPEPEPNSRAEFIRAKRLSDKEVGILDLLAKFRANKEIADELDISLPSVKKHLHSVYKKLKIASRSEVASLWRDLNNRRD